MQNNKIGKVRLKSSKRRKTRKPLPFDLSTTMNIGDCQPILCRRLDSGAKCSYNYASSVWTESLVKPTFGRLSIDVTGMFVPIKDIVPYYDAYRAGQPYAYGGAARVFDSMPKALLCEMSLGAFLGATMTIYSGDGSTQLQAYQVGSTEYTDMLNDFAAVYGPNWYNLRGVARLNPFGPGTTYTGDQINVDVLMPSNYVGEALSGMMLPICLQPSAVFGWKNDGAQDVIGVMPDEADYLVTKTINGKKYTLAFAFSAMGKRFAKMFRGAGYQVNLCDKNLTRVMSVARLMAVYKGYYDIYKVLRWSNWQNQTINRLMCKSMANALYAMSLPDTDPADFALWLYEVGNCFATDPIDYSSAHTANVADFDSRSGYASLSSFIDQDGNGNVDSALSHVDRHSTTESDFAKNPHYNIWQVIHSCLDEQLLQKWYKIVNRDSVIGKDLAAELRARGLADWVDTCDSNFIGSHTIPIFIEDCVSQSDTYQNASGEGSLLGERGGTAVGGSRPGKDTKTLVCKAKEEGYFVCIAVCRPQSGFSQGIDADCFNYSSDTEYDPEFDGLGMEATPLDRINGSENWYDESLGADTSVTFGLIPRYSGLKIQNNIANGDFANRGSATTYRPFMLDKLFDLHDKKTSNSSVVGQFWTFLLSGSFFDANNVPKAGEFWRNLYNSEWMTNFKRIFAVTADDLRFNRTYFFSDFNQWNYTHRSIDPFVFQQAVSMSVEDRKLAIADSYQVKEDGKVDGATDMAVAKS